MGVVGVGGGGGVEEKERDGDREGRQRAKSRERVRSVARRGFRQGLPVIPSSTDEGVDKANFEKKTEKKSKYRAVEAVGNRGSRLNVDVSFYQQGLGFEVEGPSRFQALRCSAKGNG
jgi:hypothetical protein